MLIEAPRLRIRGSFMFRQTRIGEVWIHFGESVERNNPNETEPIMRTKCSFPFIWLYPVGCHSLSLLRCLFWKLRSNPHWPTILQRVFSGGEWASLLPLSRKFRNKESFNWWIERNSSSPTAVCRTDAACMTCGCLQKLGSNHAADQLVNQK
jgi:hypothetical protein